MEGASSNARRTGKRRLLEAVSLAVAVVGSAAIAAPVVSHAQKAKPALQQMIDRAPAAPAPAERLVWQGADIDGDGQPDFANPTGQPVRQTDAYGCGEFGASRDGGARRHEGVDFKAAADQPVVAPISGFITKIGFAYPGDSTLKFVEITNPALHYVARVFYVDPSVSIGQAVRLGSPIGVHHTLETKYPGGMTDHVHLELIDTHGERIDAARVITAHWAPVAGPARG